MINGGKIRALRKLRGLSLRDVSVLAHGEISPSYLSEIETGKAPNPTKKVASALARVLGVREDVLFDLRDYTGGEFKMCKYQVELYTMNGWVYYCDVVASGKVLTKKELDQIGCTAEKRAKCKQMMEITCGVSAVPEPKE